MKILQDIIQFIDPTKEGLDSDTDERFIPKGHSRYRLNCRSGSVVGENKGVIENVRGNTLVSYTFPDSSARQVIGSCADEPSNYIYYFVYAVSGLHSILRYDADSNTIIDVLTDSLLNFSVNFKIHNPRFVDGFLLWTDGKNPPRQIEVEKAINYTNGTGTVGIDAYGTITTQVLDQIKHPPNCSPTIAFGTDPDIDYNNLRGKMYQISYRYVYNDDSKSVWSPYSQVAKPEGDELPDGTYFEDQTVNNFIEISLESGSDEVSRIEIAVRDRNISDFVRVEVLDRYNDDGTVNIPSNTTTTYNWYNDKEGISLSQTDFVRPFDYVPQLAGDLELLNNERLVHADITEGYDNVELDAVLQARQELADFNVGVFSVTNTGVDYQVDMTTPIITGGIYITKVELNGTDLVTVKEKAEVGDTIGDVRTRTVIAINDALNEYFSTTGVGYAFTAVAPNTQRFFITITPFITGVSGQAGTIEKTIQPKQGTYHQFGIVYYDDANRSGFVNNKGIYPDIASTTDSRGRVFIPNLNTGTSSLLYTNQFPYYVFDWRIRHQPPDWATHWQWVYAKNQSVTTWLQYFIHDNYNVSRDVDGNIRIAINESINDTNEKTVNSIVSTYSFNKGDRAKIIYRMPNADIQAETYGDLIDVEVLGFDDSTGELILPDFSPETYGLFESSSYFGFIIEVYTPRKEPIESQIYYEVGECYEIGNPGQPNRYHKGETQDQDPNNLATTPATGTMETGDSYVKLRFGYEKNADRRFLYPVEAKNFSDYYESEDYDYGRGYNTVNPDGKRKRLSNYYRHGGKIIPDSAINELFLFKFDNFDSVSLAYGSITAIRQIGFTLKILQQTKNTSQYVERTSLLDATGNPYLEKSEKIFGTKIVSEEDYGCIDKGSVAVNNRYMYFFDNRKGVYIRDAANGMLPISEYYMENHWRNVSDELKEAISYDIISYFDKRYGELNVTITANFSGARQPTGTTIVFHETSNRWKSFRSYVPEWYGRSGNRFVTFKDGNIYLQDSNSTANNFFGTQYKWIIDVYGNEQPKQNKIYQNISYHSNARFGCPDEGDILILPNEGYPVGMKSRLKEGTFKVLEGIFHAPFLNDMLDPRYTDKTEALLRGRKLRGSAMKVQLTSNTTDLSELDLITINSIISEWTG